MSNPIPPGQETSPPPSNSVPVPAGKGVQGASRTKPSKCFRALACTALSLLAIYALVGLTLHSYDLLIDDTSHGSWPFNSRPAVSTLIILQSLLLIGVIFGGIGACRQDRLWYFVSVLLLLGDAAVLAIFGVVTIHATRTPLEPKLLSGLEQGSLEDYKWIDFIQYHHKCCGISTYSDWGRINGKLNPKEDGSGFDLNRNSLPSSCCKRDVSGPPPQENCGVDALLLVGSDWKEFAAKIYVQPCGPEFIIRPARASLIHLGLEMLIASFFTCAISLFLYCGATQMFCLSPNRRNNRPRSGAHSNATDDEDDDSQEDEEDDNENDSKDVSEESSKGRSDNSSDKGRHLRSKGTPRPPPPASRGKSKSKPKEKQNGNKSGATETGSPTGKKITNPGSKSKSRSKKSRQNEVNSKKTAKLNGFNNNVSFGQSNKSPSRNSGTRSDMTLQKLEMLYDGVNKNTLSTLSTTPNPSGSLFFPWSNSNNNSSPPPPSVEAGSTLKSGGNTKKGNTLSHYSSVPHFPHLGSHPGSHYAHQKGQSWFLPSFPNSHASSVPTTPRMARQECGLESGQSQLAPDTNTILNEAPSKYSADDRLELDTVQGRSDNIILDMGQDIVTPEVVGPSPEVLDVNKTSSILLHIPDELLGGVLPPLVEATNALNLIAECDPVGSSTPDESTESSPQSTGTSSTASVGVAEGPVSNSSLGFNATGTGESSESELEEDDQVGEGLTDGDLLTCRKSKARFPTLPTIVEEPEPNTPKKESPTESESEFKKGEAQAGDVEGNEGQILASSIANANVNVNLFGSSA